MGALSAGRARAPQLANACAAPWSRLSRWPPARALTSGGAEVVSGIDEFDRPLRPLAVQSHARRYQMLDDFNEQFNKFVAVFPDERSLRVSGHLFVVTGDRGYGKTSLRQRCAFWMKEEYANTSSEIIVVDLSDEDWKGDTIDVRTLRTRDWILSSMAGCLKNEDIDHIRNYEDMLESFRVLGAALRARRTATDSLRPVCLVALLQGYPSVEEIKLYYRLAREGMVFIAEIFDPDAIRGITGIMGRKDEGFNRSGVALHLLRLGALNTGDGERLMRWIQSDLQGCPSLTNPEFMASIDALIKIRKLGAAELIKLLIGTVRVAIAEQADEVTMHHVHMYFEQALFRSA
jgi:hypothetical protein